MAKIICFDMDGTIADLYAVPNWLLMLRAGDPTPYKEARPMWDMLALHDVCRELQSTGWEIQIITAMSKGASPEYKQLVRQAKREWLALYGVPYDRFHGIDYMAPKHRAIRRDMPCPMGIFKDVSNVIDLGEAILVDDEARHREKWGWGRTIDPTAGNLITALKNLVKEG